MKFKVLKYLVVLLILSSSVGTNQAQNRGKCASTKNKKARELYAEALRKQGINSKTALSLLKSAIKKDNRFIDAYYLSARLNFDNAVRTTNEAKKKEKYKEGVKFFKKCINICRSFDDYKSYFYIAKTYYNQKEYRKSKIYFEDFIRFTPAFVKRGEAELLLDNVNEYIHLVDNPVIFKPYKLPGVSSGHDEYLPTLSPDNETFYYTRKISDQAGNFKEYFNSSLKTSKRGVVKETFTKGSHLPQPFNDGRNQGGATLTVDNNHMYFTICGIDRTTSNSYKNCDIYYAKKERGKWVTIEKVPPAINGSFSFEGQPTITPDGRTMYFASYREGGYGEMDLFCSVKNANGNWGKAFNLGPQINTLKNEKTPFIHPDGKTLYFASDGRFGMGGFDIFYSTHSNTEGWSEPKNIGYPINSENDEVAFAVSTDGNRLYFSSNTISSKDNWDIYSADMPELAKPQQVLLVKGKIQNDSGDTISEIKVVVKSMLTKKTTRGFADKVTGDYALSVPVIEGEKFVLTAKRKNHIYNSIFIDPEDELYFPPPTQKDIFIKKIVKGASKRLTNVNFQFDSFQLSDTATFALEELVEFMNDNPEISIEIRGHTDNAGTADSNKTLSFKRAQSVSNFLLIKGINKKRLKFKAFGESKPIASNSTEKGRAENRRVEFIIL